MIQKIAKNYCQHCGAYNMRNNIHDDGLCWACHMEIGFNEYCSCTSDGTKDCEECQHEKEHAKALDQMLGIIK